MPRESEVAAELRRFYGLSADFPWAQLLSCRQHELSRRLYLTSARGAAALACRQLRVLRAGVKAFERDTSAGVGCSLRIVQEGALLLLPYLGRRVVRTSPAGLGAMLRARVIPLPSNRSREADDAGGEPEIAQEIAPDLTEVSAALAACHPNGCCVVACERSATGASGDKQRGSRGDEQRSARLAVVVMKYTDKAIVEL